MNPQTVYQKSPKGREELSTRRDGLPAKLRVLLIQIDGQQSAQTLAERNGGGGAFYERLQQLIDAHYIVAAEPGSSPGPNPAVVARP